jgi:hypothetical protein
VPEDIAALPNALGSGNVCDLQQAMAMDTSNTLKGLVESFISATDEASRNTLLDEIIAKWAGVSVTIDLQSGSMLWATHTSVVEQFEGMFSIIPFPKACRPIPPIRLSGPCLRPWSRRIITSSRKPCMASSWPKPH